MIEYTLKNVKEYGEWDEIHVFFNTQNRSVEIPVMTKGLQIIANASKSGLTSLGEVGNELSIEPLSTTIIVK